MVDTTTQGAPSPAPLDEDLLEIRAVDATDRRRFCFSLSIGAAIVLVPYLWVVTVDWNGGPSLFRTVNPGGLLSNFYDLQGRALLAGHLYVPNGSLGEEAFLHGGHQYTYFGPFPSLIRLPVLLVTHSLDGRMTAISILLAWIVTAVTSGIVLWHCRLALRGASSLGGAEAATYAIVFAAILGGSALVNLAANPWVYSEDIAWSIALSLVATVALVAVLARPSWWRVTVLFVSVLAVNLTRGTTGLAWSAGAIAAGVWLGWRRRAGDTPNLWLPTIASGVIPLVVSFVISWLKFGVFNGYPLQDQVAFRTLDLARINHGHYFSLNYLPTGLSTYFGSLGVHVSSVFPFFTLPQFPVQGAEHTVLFGSEQMTSVPGSMPLLLILTIVGVLGILRPSSPQPVRLMIIPLVAAALTAGPLLVFGYLDNRFVGDFLPLLIIGSAVGLAVAWQYVGAQGTWARWCAVGAISLLSAYSLAANFGMSITPTGWWSSQQAAAYVRAQERVGGALASPVSDNVIHRSSLPDSGPVGQIVIVGRCKGVYFAASTGLKNWIPIGGPVFPSGASCRLGDHSP
jgi:hypothetical protein